MRAVHLGMVELEGDGQSYFEPMLAVSAPTQEGIGENTTVLVDNAIEFRASYCRRAYYHSLIVKNVLTGLADGLCQMQVIGIKLFQIVADGNVAETESAFDVIRYHVDGHAVVFIQFPSHSRRTVAYP